MFGGNDRAVRENGARDLGGDNLYHGSGFRGSLGEGIEQTGVSTIAQKYPQLSTRKGLRAMLDDAERIRDRQVQQEMTLEAVVAIIEGVNPRALEMQLNRYLNLAPKEGLKKVASR